MPDILVIKPSSLGDIIHGLQVAESLRSQMPDCRITWVVGDQFAPLVQACPTVDDYMVYERHGGLRKIIRLLTQIRKRKFDIVIDFQGLARSGLMTMAARAERKLGRSDAREGATLAYREKAPLPQSGSEAHALEILLQFLPLLDCRAELRGQLQFNINAPKNFDADLLERRPVILFPESRRPEKEWGGFVELTSRLLRDRPDLDIVLAGSTAIDGLPSWPDARIINILGKTGLDELAVLVSRASLVVANDSGPMHLAAALQVPVIGLFGPTSPERFGPYPIDSPANQIIQAPHGDLSRLTLDTVYETIASSLAQI